MSINNIPHTSSMNATGNNGGSPRYVDKVAAALAVKRLDQATEGIRAKAEPDPIFKVRLPLEPGGNINVTS